MALLQAQHPPEAEPRLGVSRIDAQRTLEERLSAAKLRSGGADGELDARGWSSGPDELLHLRRRERFVQASAEHRQHRIVRKQAKRFIEVLGVQMYLAKQRGARCAVPRSHSAVCRRGGTHPTEERSREFPLVGCTIDAHLATIGEEDDGVPSGCTRSDRTLPQVSRIRERNRRMQQRAAFQHPVARGKNLPIVVRCGDLPVIAAVKRQRQTTNALELGPGVHDASGKLAAGAVNPDLEGAGPGVLHQFVQRLHFNPQVVQLRRRPLSDPCNRLVCVSRVTEADRFDPDVQPVHAGTAPIQVGRLKVGNGLRVQCGGRCGHRQDGAQSGTTHASDRKHQVFGLQSSRLATAPADTAGWRDSPPHQRRIRPGSRIRRGIRPPHRR